MNWNNVNEKLPALEGEYLCVVKCHGIRIRKFISYGNDSRIRWCSNGVETKKVTHWMPLPEPPINDK